MMTYYLKPWLRCAHDILIKELTLNDKSSGESVTWSNLGEVVEKKHEFEASIWNVTVGSVKLSVAAKDYAGNYISAEKELKGALGQVLDALAKIWNAIWSTLEKAAQAMEQAMQVFIGMIKWVVNEMWEKMQAVLNAIYGPLIAGLINIITGNITYGDVHSDIVRANGEDSNGINVNMGEIIAGFFALVYGTGVVYRMLALDSGMITLETVLTYLSGGLEKLATKIIETFTMDNIKTIIKGVFESLKSGLLGAAMSIVGVLLAGGIGEMLDKLGDLVKLPAEIKEVLKDMKSMIPVLVGRLEKNKNPIWYYAALVGATFGLTISILKNAIPVKDKNKRLIIDSILLAANIVGFVSWIKIKNSGIMRWRKLVADMTTTLEFFAGIASIVLLLINFVQDAMAKGGA